MINVFMAGNISQDAEVRRIPSGDAVANFSVAINQGKDKQAIFMRATLFGKRAEGALPSFLVKGQPVAVSGSLTVNKYKDKEGIERTSYDVRVQELDLLGSKRQEEAPRQAPKAAPQMLDDDSMIPF